MPDARAPRMKRAKARGRAAALERPIVRGAQQPDTWRIAVETPVEVGINGVAWTVMMATPSDLEDLAIGLAYTERVVTDPDAIERAVVADYLEGLAVDLVVPASAVDDGARRRRTLEGRVGCGLCGVEALESLPVRARARAGERVAIAHDAIRRGFDALPARQPLNRATHSVHAAAWCQPSGDIDLVREDVGRHNALDKAIGALARSKRLDEPGFFVLTSRCSFELVYKAAATAAGVLATLSAPTSLALEWSETLELPIVCRGRDGELVAFD